jgi:hypothetical protein
MVRPPKEAASFALFSLRKFPVLMHREYRRKRPDSRLILAIWIRQLVSPRPPRRTKALQVKPYPRPRAARQYSRGEGQKPVTTAYKENWNAIYAKKNAKKKKR